MMDEHTQAVPPVFVALDYSTADEARRIVEKLGNNGIHYKVGLQLYVAAGRSFVEELVDMGKQIFLDLKFHDIPNTVYGAVAEVAKMGVQLLTVHANGGKGMLQAAVDAAHTYSGSSTETRVLAVTLLTSLNQYDLESIGCSANSVSDHVVRLAKLADTSGVYGVVCSAHELAAVRKVTTLKTLVPGIRPKEACHADQARVATPSQAFQLGANYLVVGRPITQDPDPVRALLAIQTELSRTGTGEIG